MSEQLCDICKKEPVRIHIVGKGDYCLNCHNEMLLEEFGLKDTFQYADTMSVVEPSGKLHTFKIEHVILGPIVTWEAVEQGGTYKFKTISDIEENGANVARKFFEKIVNGVCTKSLTEYECADILLHKDGKIYGLRDKGTINIIESDDHENEVAFEIDGIHFSGEELGRLFGSHVGFTVQYKIQDASEPILKEDEYLIPVKITRQTLVNELKYALDTYGDRGFLCYKNVFLLDEVLWDILERLDVLLHSGKRDAAVEAGKEMISILMKTETDDDWFPIHEMQCIAKIIDPFGADEEVKDLFDEWENSL